MKLILFVFYLTVFGLIMSSCSEDPIEFENPWEEDVHFFGEELKMEHVDLFFNISEEEFDSDIDRLKSQTPALNPNEIVIGMMKIISKIGDPHTVIASSSVFESIPMAVEYLSDGIFLTAVHPDHEDVLSKKIIAINSLTVDSYLDSLAKVLAYDNQSNFINQVVNLFSVRDFYEYFGFKEAGNALQLSFEDGTERTLEFQSNEIISVIPPRSPLFLKNLENYYWYEVLTEDRIMYIQYNRCREKSNESFFDFTESIKSTLGSNPDISKIVFDIRLNSGGNSSIARVMIDYFEELVQEGIISHDDLYLVIGRKTFSSALLNALEIRDRIDPVLVGEPTGGKPNHYGELRSFQLPNSKLQVWYSTSYFEEEPGVNNDALYPDILIDYGSDERFQGVDPVIEFIKNQ